MKDFFKKKMSSMQEIEHLTRKRMDTIRSSSDPSLWIQAKIRTPKQQHMRSSYDLLR